MLDRNALTVNWSDFFQWEIVFCFILTVRPNRILSCTFLASVIFKYTKNLLDFFGGCSTRSLIFGLYYNCEIKIAHVIIFFASVWNNG